MKFIQLTEHTGDPIIFNFDAISYVGIVDEEATGKRFTVVGLIPEGEFRVKETPEEIWQMVK